MKRYIIPAVFAAVLALAVWLSLSPARQEHLYPMAAIVTELDYTSDMVIVTDGAGIRWRFPSIDDWGRGDLAALLMDDAGTPNYIYDDLVVMVRYAGVLEP